MYFRFGRAGKFVILLCRNLKLNLENRGLLTRNVKMKFLKRHCLELLCNPYWYIGLLLFSVGPCINKNLNFTLIYFPSSVIFIFFLSAAIKFSNEEIKKGIR